MTDEEWEEYNLWLERQGLHDEECPGWLIATWEFLGYMDGEEVWYEIEGTYF